MKLLSIGLVFALTVSSAFAADLKTLQDEAVKNRSSIKKYNVNFQKQDDIIRQNRAGYMPSLDAAYTVNRLDEPSATEEKHNSVASLTMSVNLFNGFATKYNLKSAKLRKSAQKFQLTGAEQDLKLDVALKYLSVFRAESSVKVAESQHIALKKLYDDAKVRFDVGMISRNELLRIKVDLDNAYISLRKAKVAYDISVNNLSFAVQAAVNGEDLEFDTFKGCPDVAAKDSNKELMLKNRSEVQYLSMISKSYEAMSKAEKGDYYPKLNASLGYKRYDNRYANGSGDYDRMKDGELRAQLSLSLNLFNGLKTKGAVDASKKDIHMARLDLVELRNSLLTSLDNLYMNYEVSKLNVNTASESIAQAEENLRITKLAYEEGLNPLSDLLDAVTNLSRAKSNKVAAVADMYSNYYQIVRAVEGF